MTTVKKKGILEDEEIEKIKQYVKEDYNDKDICELLGRSKLDKDVRAFTKNMDQLDDIEVVYKETTDFLIKFGVKPDVAKKLIISSIKQIKDMTNPKEAADLIISGTSFKDLMIKESLGGKHDVSVMTMASSQRVDIKSNTPGFVGAKDNIYTIKKK